MGKDRLLVIDGVVNLALGIGAAEIVMGARRNRQKPR